ncbi:hypothetical protein BpHYR1_019070 [Brachionus plicatilis]|uniref:Uncharacterized protein n=1 Tax=Brachionus plicatilis TaxID=10195 RepID=A0A3M7SFA7_BRAPC|nr:hypothetical protein BpHYR1_019070 [Brachionus plicatilis]
MWQWRKVCVSFLSEDRHCSIMSNLSSGSWSPVELDVMVRLHSTFVIRSSITCLAICSIVSAGFSSADAFLLLNLRDLLLVLKFDSQLNPPRNFVLLLK